MLNKIHLLKLIPQVETEKPNSQFQWTGSKSDLIELSYALYYIKALNNGQITLNQIISTFEQVFNVKLQNFSRTLIDIKNKQQENLFVVRLNQTFSNQIKLNFK